MMETAQSLKPFAQGDIFVAATALHAGARYPTGDSGVLQLDGDWRPKALARTGRIGLVSGLALGPDRALWVFDPQARAVDRFAPDGRRIAPPELPSRPFGSALPARDGGLIMGEHLCGAHGAFAGEGKAVRIDREGQVTAVYDTEWNGGVGGFLGVTHIALSRDEGTLFHVSETGPHLYAHDLERDRRLGAIYTRADPPAMLFGLATLADGDLLIATGSGVRRLASNGALRRDYALPTGRGWANIVARPDRATVWALDFILGRVAELDPMTGTVGRVVELGLAQSLSTLVEIPAR
jgi:sugar lactone lactonase YvrE